MTEPIIKSFHASYRAFKRFRAKAYTTSENPPPPPPPAQYPIPPAASFNLDAGADHFDNAAIHFNGAAADLKSAANAAESDDESEEEDGHELYYDCDEWEDPLKIPGIVHATVFEASSMASQEPGAPDPNSNLTVPNAGGSQLDDESRISAVRKDSDYEPIGVILAGESAKDIIDALYNTPCLDGHISARLLSHNRCRSVCEPGTLYDSDLEFSDFLPGGTSAVKDLWQLFSLTMKYGLATLAHTIISGGYWGERLQAYDIIYHIAATTTWFKTLYTRVESSPLARYFLPLESHGKRWDRASPIDSSSGFIYWFCLQIVFTVRDFQTVIFSIVHHFARRTVQKYDTAGFKISDCEEEGPYTVADEATHVLRITGCIGTGHGEAKIPADYNSLIFLHTSLTVEKLTNRALLLLGQKNIGMAVGLYHSPEERYKLPYTSLALGATIVEIELRALRNLGFFYGEFMEPFTGQFTRRQQAIMERHREYLDVRNEKEYHVPELYAVRKKIRRAFRIKTTN